jgi:CRISPR/Cas system CMR-associated protein Cmr5 small subunit
MSGRPNLDQVRARNALRALEKKRDLSGKEGGDALSGFPALVANNGLMATLAFSKRQGGGYVAIGDAAAEHLASQEIGLLSQADATLDGLLNRLCQSDSSYLRVVTAEVVAFLNYLRRFHKAEREKGKSS